MNDPYLKPVILGGILIAILSIIFAPGIFIWAGIGGYITTRLVFKMTKETIKYTEGLLLGLMSGLLSCTLLDIFTVISFKSPENERIIMRLLEKNLPKDVSMPQDLSQIFPSVMFTTCLIIIIICALFAIIGGYIGVLISNKTKTNKNKESST